MTTDTKKLEASAYARGYAAGKKKRQREALADRLHAQNTAFLHRAFMAALPAAIVAQGWARGNKPINNLQERTALAWDIADQALKQRRYPKA